MAQQENQSRHRNTPVSAKTCDPRFLPYHLLNLKIIRQSKRRIGAMKYIPTCRSFLTLLGVSWSQFSIWGRPTSVNSSSATLSFWPSRLVLSAMYCFQRGHFDSRLLIRVMQWSIRRFHCSGPASCLLMMVMDCAISQTCSLTLLSICCVVKPPLSCHIPMVSAAHWLTPSPAFSVQMQTCRVGIWIVSASTTTDFGN